MKLDLLRSRSAEGDEPSMRKVRWPCQRCSSSDATFQVDRMTAALLDRLTHRCTIFAMKRESYRFRESAKRVKQPKEKATA